MATAVAAPQLVDARVYRLFHLVHRELSIVRYFTSMTGNATQCVIDGLRSDYQPIQGTPHATGARA